MWRFVALKSAASLRHSWQGQLVTTSAEELASVIGHYEHLLEQFGRVQSHAQLLFAANTADPEIARHHQSMRDVLGAEIHAKILFVELELARFDTQHADSLANPNFGAFRAVVAPCSGDGALSDGLQKLNR